MSEKTSDSYENLVVLLSCNEHGNVRTRLHKVRAYMRAVTKSGWYTFPCEASNDNHIVSHATHDEDKVNRLYLRNLHILSMFGVEIIEVPELGQIIENGNLGTMNLNDFNQYSIEAIQAIHGNLSMHIQNELT